MKAVVLSAFRTAPKVDRIPRPSPAANQVMVKVRYSALHPADFGTIQGKYHAKPTVPCVLGIEGSGEVVSKGELLGRKVAFFTASGTWCEYAVTAFDNVLPLPDNEDLRVASCSFCNPLTALMLLKRVQGKSLLINAGASALSKALLKQAAVDGVQAVAIVRK